jgi:hypothetical protein
VVGSVDLRRLIERRMIPAGQPGVDELAIQKY